MPIQTSAYFPLINITAGGGAATDAIGGGGPSLGSGGVGSSAGFGGLSPLLGKGGIGGGGAEAAEEGAGLFCIPAAVCAAAAARSVAYLGSGELLSAGRGGGGGGASLTRGFLTSEASSGP